MIIGIFDLSLAGKMVLALPAWQAYSTEMYIVLAAIYFVFCYVMARYSRGIERDLSRSMRGVESGGHHHEPNTTRSTGRWPSQSAITLPSCLDKVNKWYGAMHVLRDVSMTVGQGERVVVCGPSGSGKSTMIRCINRLETHQEGKIIVDGTELTDDTRALDTIRREVGMVFQSFNLFPHLTILENLHAGADLGAEDAEGGGGGVGDELLAPGQDSGAGEEVSGSALRWAAAAGRDRAGAVHEAAGDAVR